MAKAPQHTQRRQTDEPANSTTPTSQPFADGDLGKIQSILFGEQSHQFETQLAEMSTRLDRMVSQTSSEFSARINALEAEHQKRLDALHKSLDEKTAALEAAKLDSKAAGRILTAAAEQISQS